MEDFEKYIYNEIIPRYAAFDSAHREDHAMTVIEQALKLMRGRDGWISSHPEINEEWKAPIDENILLAAAACHDLGLANGRERHHLDSGTIIRNDQMLREWFSDDEIEIIAQAAEDHRASGKSEPRSLYGKLVAEADRVIDGRTIIIRTIQYGLNNYLELDHKEHLDRATAHLKEKYGKGGYLKLWIPWSDNAARLEALQEIIADEDAVYKAADDIFRTLTNTKDA